MWTIFLKIFYFILFFKVLLVPNISRALSASWALGVLIPMFFFFPKDKDDSVDTHCLPDILLYCMHFQNKTKQKNKNQI